jgi:sulfite exporter TauE/SafE
MWYTALLIGITSSLHCAGMCSPLLMAVTNLTPAVALNRVLYNGGRILTYGLLGAAAGSAGSFFPVARYQNLVSIAFGVILILAAMLRIDRLNIPILMKGASLITAWIKTKFTFFLSRKSSPAIFMMGMLNGFLPCGMTLLALSYCMVLHGAWNGFNFMLVFGAGTLPVMIGLAPVILMGIKNLNFSFHKVTTSLMILSGVLLIARIFIHAGIEASEHHGEMIDIVLCR